MLGAIGEGMKNTKHNTGACTMSFGRYSLPGVCKRCDELRAGAAPRKLPYTPRDRAAEARDFRTALAAHDCRASNCGPVCVHFDW